MTRSSSPRYYLASIALVLLVVAAYGAWAARRTQAELRRQLEEKAAALAETVETSSRSAIRANALMEELVAQRLLDNARLVDRLLETRPLGPADLVEMARANRLRRIDLLDPHGRPVAPPSVAPGEHMPGPGAAWGPDMMRERMRRRMAEMQEAGLPFRPGAMLHMWGRRWSRATDPDAAGAAARTPAAIRDRKFWEGSLFGVAVGARSFQGIIAVHADAAFVLDFRREAGVERQIEEVGRQAGVETVALLGPDLTVLAHSQPDQAGARVEDPALAAAAAGGRVLSRLVRPEDGPERLEVARPLALQGGRAGLLVVGLSTTPMRDAWRRDVRSTAVFGASVLLAGALGLGLVFYRQSRHLREVQALEAQVERHERLAAVGNLAAAVAHEVRNPLNAISVGLQRLRAEFEPADGADEFGRVVGLVQGEVRRLDGIVEQFLSLARPPALRLEPVRVGDLLGEVAALVEPEAASRGARALTEVEADLPPLPLDRDRVKQVLLNLVGNALDAMPSGGTLTLRAARGRGGVALTVADTGEGIPPDLLPRIFEPYVTTKAKGMGLGLAIARRIVEAHGGALTARNRDGRGAVFEVVLPSRPPEGAAGA